MGEMCVIILNVDSQDDVAKMITEFLPDIESDQSEFGGQSYQTKLTHISFLRFTRQ